MIKDKKELEKFEINLIKNDDSDFEKRLMIFEQLVIFARQQGYLPPKNPLEDIELDIKYAKAINDKRITNKSCKKT